MESLLLLVAWMSIGAVCAIRFGPSGAIPIAVFFGPLWLAIIDDMDPEVTPARVAAANSGGDV